MLNNVYIKIERADGEVLEIGSRTSRWYFLKQGIEGFSKAEVQLTYNDHSIKDGGYVSSSRMTKTDRTIKASYTNPALNETERRRINSFLASREPYKVYMYYGSNILWAEGYVYKFECTIGAKVERRLDLTVTFLFPDPYWKSYDNFGKDIASVKPLIAFPFLCASSHDYGIDEDEVQHYGPTGVTGSVFVFQPEVELYNDGDSVTYPRIVISAYGGPVTNPTVVINGASLKINDVIHAGEKVDIDFENTPPTVTKGDDNILYKVDRTSDFLGMNLLQGSNTISYHVEDGAANVMVNVYYNKRYESV